MTQCNRCGKSDDGQVLLVSKGQALCVSCLNTMFESLADSLRTAYEQLASVLRYVIENCEIGRCPNGCSTRMHVNPGRRCLTCDTPMVFQPLADFGNTEMKDDSG